MNTFKKFLAWTLMVISILGILVCALGIFGSWAINDDLTARILNLLSGANAALSRVEDSLTLASTQLESANSAIATVREAASQLGDRIESNSPILDRILGVLQEQLGPAVSRVREVFLQIEDRVQTVNSTIELVNRFPGIELPSLSLEFQALRDQVDRIDQAVQQLQLGILDFRAGIVQSLAPFMDKVDTIAGFLTRLEQDVNTYLEQVQSLQVAVTEVQAQVPSTIDNITMMVTILLLWSILAQTSLILAAILFLRTGRMIWEAYSTKQPAEPATLTPGV